MILVGVAWAEEAPAEEAPEEAGEMPAPETPAPEAPAPEAPAPARPRVVTASLHGNVKTFVVASFPFDGWIYPEDPSGTALATSRQQLAAAAGPIRLEVHHDLAFSTGATGIVPTTTGVGEGAAEAVDLSWTAIDEGVDVRGRVDRLNLQGSFGPVEVALGRQAVSFGSGVFFTPLDLVNPFTPTTLDTEFKPGVDAARVDAYPSPFTRITGVAAYAGGWDADGLVAALWGQGTVGVTDLGGFAGLVHGDVVLGASVVSAAGPFGLHADAAVTLPAAGDPFVRAVAGGDVRPGPNTTVSIEGYLQTLGETDPDRYLLRATEDRWARGELWLYGVGYVGVAVSHQLTPLLTASAASVVNVVDPSAFVAPSLSWSVAENAELSAGAYFGAGARPGPVDTEALGSPDPEVAAAALGINSEFGYWPSVGWMQVRLYF